MDTKYHEGLHLYAFPWCSFVPLVVNLFQVSRDLLVARYDKTSSAAYNVSWSSLVGACPQFPFPNPREDASIRGSVPGENLSRCEFVGFALQSCCVSRTRISID